jgi:hypothetical protein
MTTSDLKTALREATEALKLATQPKKDEAHEPKQTPQKPENPTTTQPSPRR